MKRIIFLCAFSISKSIGNNIFLLPTDLLMEKKLPKKKIHQRSISVDDFGGKLITNGMIVQIPMKNSAVNLKIVVLNVEG
jgi:hypothetical protein